MINLNSQAIAHLYRGEMNRLTIYRSRLDMTTNWCITLISALIVLFINLESIPHYFYLFLLVPIILFSCIEARRYRYYKLSQFRVRLLEKGYYCQLFESTCANDWISSLTSSLYKPQDVITFKKALIVRWNRNYIWLCYLVILGYILHSVVHDFYLIFAIPLCVTVSLVHMVITLLTFTSSDVDI